MEKKANPWKSSSRLFLRDWYGRPGLGQAGSGRMAGIAETASIPTVPEIPYEIVDWHDAVLTLGTRVTFQNRPVPLSELTRSDDGMIVFWIENQGAYHWAVDPDEKSHEVFVRESRFNPWLTTGEILDQFLLHCTITEAILGSQSKFSALIPDSNLREHMQSKFTPLRFQPLASEDPMTRLLYNHNALAKVAPPPIGYSMPGERDWMLTIAMANNQNMLEYRSELEAYILPTPPRVAPIELSIEDLPF